MISSTTSPGMLCEKSASCSELAARMRMLTGAPASCAPVSVASKELAESGWKAATVMIRSSPTASITVDGTATAALLLGTCTETVAPAATSAARTIRAATVTIGVSIAMNEPSCSRSALARSSSARRANDLSMVPLSFRGSGNSTVLVVVVIVSALVVAVPVVVAVVVVTVVVVVCVRVTVVDVAVVVVWVVVVTGFALIPQT
mmetsp:Transcript_118563/g.330790  ORF Transcript_118563/g.330790 Transcript_118563/m.330790 type:complete len:203 (-) Transcript_118563:389-997(-)